MKTQIAVILFSTFLQALEAAAVAVADPSAIADTTSAGKSETRVVRQSGSSSSASASSSSGPRAQGSASGLSRGASNARNTLNTQYNEGGGGGYPTGGGGGGGGYAPQPSYGVPDDTNYDYGDERTTVVKTPPQQHNFLIKNYKTIGKGFLGTDYTLVKDALGNEYAVADKQLFGHGHGQDFVIVKDANDYTHTTHTLVTKESLPVIQKEVHVQDYAVIPETQQEYVVVNQAVPKSIAVTSTSTNSGNGRKSSAVIGLRASTITRPTNSNGRNAGVSGFVRNLFGGYRDFRDTLSGLFIPSTAKTPVNLLKIAVEPVVLSHQPIYVSNGPKYVKAI